MSDDNKSVDAETAKNIKLIQEIAIRLATAEIIQENRDEIVRRARAKLVAQGLPPEPGSAE